jgi:Tfp pilus assembly protein PilO
MPRSFKAHFDKVTMKDPRVAARLVVGILLAANLAAAVFAFHPWGGSAEDLRRLQEQLRAQAAQAEARLESTRALVAKVEQARREGDDFLSQYVTDARVTSSVLIAELNRTAGEAGIRQKEATFVLEPVEGSDTLSQMTITAGYEGTYANLTKFVNLLDKSPRFLIVANMTAAPQQSGPVINVSFKLDTFVRETAESAT